MNFQPFLYMKWAKEHAFGEGFKFTRSGMLPFPTEILDPYEFSLDLSEVDPYGPMHAKELLAKRAKTTPDRVFLTGGGASMALFLVHLSLLEPGDSVLVERPGYEALEKLPALMHAKAIPLDRTGAVKGESEATSLYSAMEKGLFNGAKAAVITNPHNPSGTWLTEEELYSLASLCEKHEAFLVVDEVYTEFIPPWKRPKCAHVIHPRAITISSLTKAFGLGALRAGWIIGDPQTIKRLEELNDLVQVVNPTPSFKAFELALERERAVYAWLKEELSRIRPFMERLSLNKALDFQLPKTGITIFTSVKGLDKTDGLCRFLSEEKGVHTTPGAFFQDGSRMRLGLSLPENELEQAVTEFEEGLDTYLESAT